MPKNLPEWLSYLETLPSGLTNVSSGLDNIKAVANNCNLLDWPSKTFIITVGGTNGKGSCVTFLEAILLTANYKVGAYISPHLLQYNERIHLQGNNVDDETLCQAFTYIEKVRGSIPLSYFEFTTLAALYIFKQQPLALEVLILEVGLGGRFDAVNIVDSDISIITTISLDHVQQLGDNRENIGREKAGIMRPNKPTICGDFNPPQSIFQSAEKINTHLHCINRDFSYAVQNNCWEWTHKNTKLAKLPIPHLPIQDAATALMAITLMQQNFTITKKAIAEGLQKAFMLGRFQLLEYCGQKVILDVAHNQESANLLYHNLTKQHAQGRTLAVTSMLKDKDIEATFKELKTVIDKWYVGQLHHPRAALPNQLKKNIGAIQLKEVVYCDDMVEAFKAALANCDKNNRIVVFGSFYSVAEVLKFILNST